MHATDARSSRAMDLYIGSKEAENPRSSPSLVVCLAIAPSPGFEAVKSAARTVRLTNRRYLTHWEPRWTCRVWVMEVMFAFKALTSSIR
jgi:hypothetical protein